MKQITKTYLQYLGIVDVSEDGKVFTKNGERKPCIRSKRGLRLAIKLHDSDKYAFTETQGQVVILLHHIVYAWFKGEVPYGKQVHHIDGNYLNNSIDNLEALTPEEHRAKHVSLSTKEIKCRLDIPRIWYEKKLKEVQNLPNSGNKRSRLSKLKAQLRYYDNHIEEANQMNEFKKDLMELAYWKKTFKESGNKKNWHECISIEKIVKTKGIEAWPIVKHALEVCHKHFGG